MKTSRTSLDPASRRTSTALLLAMMLTACYVASPASAAPPAVVAAPSVVAEAVRTFIGWPYRLGGDSARGLDCSALVQRAFRAVGMELPRTVKDQFLRGCAVAREELAAGDLVFFRGPRGRGVSHVGVYVGSAHFIHAGRHGVAIASMLAPHWARRFAGARRLIEVASDPAVDAGVCVDGS